MSQHMDALAGANRQRLAGADFRREVADLDRHDGAIRVATALRDNDPAIRGLRMRALLTAIEYVGDHYVRVYLTEACPYSPTMPMRRVRELTDRQRGEVADVIERVGEGSFVATPRMRTRQLVGE